MRVRFYEVAITFLVVVAHACMTVAVDVILFDSADIWVGLQDHPDGGISVVLERNDMSEILAVVGRQAGAATRVTVGTNVVIRFANNTYLIATASEAPGRSRGIVVSLSWEAPKNSKLEDCFYYGSHHWYGGPQQKQQYWPIENLNIQTYSYVTKEADNCGVAERYWLGSSGIFYMVGKTVPLFVDSNNVLKDAACFIAQTEAPYTSKREINNLAYVIGIFEDVRKAHEFAIDAYLHKPTGYPDELMIKYPIWSTWARSKRNVNHDLVLEFADNITKNGFPNSQIEVDDLWEICYGSLTVDVKRFPNMKSTTYALRTKGYRTTIWVHPFLNKGCEPWYSDALNAGYLVSSEEGSVETSWWNDNGTTTSYIDFTKPEVKTWYLERLQTLKDATGVDSYKFDGGESSWSPQIPILQGDVMDQPNLITSEYVRTVATFGSLVEVRVGHGTQDLPIFVRIIDKDSYWTFENGLPTLITTLFQMNMNGYPLVLPDMIGGNGYSNPPSKELFIRWLQANTFMPSMQFSYVPWDYDDETTAISKQYVELHAEYAPVVIAACQKAVSDGSPVNPPIWWIAPNDTEAHRIWDEYLLGETILVAPVLTPNSTSRHIYLPEGIWYEQGNTTKVIEGPVWLRDYPAPLDVLPYFVRKDSPNDADIILSSIVLVASCVIANIFYCLEHI